jgi:hypothetical protein
MKACFSGKEKQKMIKQKNKIKNLKTKRITNKEPKGIQFVFLPGQITDQEFDTLTKRFLKTIKTVIPSSDGPHELNIQPDGTLSPS